MHGPHLFLIWDAIRSIERDIGNHIIQSHFFVDKSKYVRRLNGPILLDGRKEVKMREAN